MSSNVTIDLPDIRWISIYIIIVVVMIIVVIDI